MAVLLALSWFPNTTLGLVPQVSRSQFLKNAGWSLATAAVATKIPLPAKADESGASKRTNLSNDELKEVVEYDLLKNQFLATGQLTRNVYDESATFTDEIDTYTLDKWIKGTQKLFNGENSAVRLVGDIDVTSERVEFRFDEDLQFNIPFKPTVSLTGKVVLARDPSSGLITSYREFWDQDVATVLTTAKF